MAKHQKLIKTRKLFQAALAPLTHNVQIQPGRLLRRIEIYLLGALVLSAGTVNGTSTGLNPGGLLQRAEVSTVKAGPYVGGTIKSLSTRTMFARRIVDRGRAQFDLKLGSGGIAGTNGTYNLNSRFDITFENPKAAKPIETALRADQYSQITLKLLNGGVQTILPGNNATVDYTGVYYEIIEVWENAGADGKYMPLAVMVEDDPTVYINQSQKRFSIESVVPKGEDYGDALFLFESANQQLVDTLDNSIQVYTAGEQLSEGYQEELKSQLQDYVSEGSNTVLTGMRYFDIAEGMLSGVQPDVTALMDVNSVSAGSDRVFVSTRRYIYPRTA